MPPTSKTLGTERFYDRVAGLLMRHAARMEVAGNMGVIADRNVQIAFAFLDLEPTVTAATARLYRAAAVSFIARNPGPMDEDAEAILAPEPTETDYIQQEQLDRKRKTNLTVLRGAQQKAKWIQTADWDRLLRALTESSSHWAQPAVHWIMATLITGLRPCEWKSACLLGTQLQLMNAKATNGRSHSLERTLDLSRLPEAQLKLIGGFICAFHRSRTPVSC